MRNCDSTGLKDVVFGKRNPAQVIKPLQVVIVRVNWIGWEVLSEPPLRVVGMLDLYNFEVSSERRS